MKQTSLQSKILNDGSQTYKVSSESKAFQWPKKGDQTLRVTEQGCLSTPLFCVAWIAKSLNQKMNCYQKYGLTSSLASCSTTLSVRKTYIAKTVDSSLPATEKLCFPKSLLNFDFVSNRHNFDVTEGLNLLTATSVWNKESSLENLEGNKGSHQSFLTSTSYVLAKTFENGISFAKTLPIENWGGNVVTEESPENSSSNDTYLVKISPFKVSRDYISSDSSEGFEDWSFLDQKRPYDSLVRENISELLEDLETFGSRSSKETSTISSSGDSRGYLKALGNFEEIQSGNSGTFPMNATVPSLGGNNAFEEHLFSSDIHKTYANRLRLEQRMKYFYGFTSLTTKYLKASTAKSKKLKKSLQNFHFGSQSVWDIYLQLEERIDIQLFRLNWVSSLAHARQVLKHKHIGILGRKDRLLINEPFLGSPEVSQKTESKQQKQLSTAAASNLFLKEGDLLYWRDIRIPLRSSYLNMSTPNTDCWGIGNKVAHSHKFPWFSYINDNEDSKATPSELKVSNTSRLESQKSFILGTGIDEKNETLHPLCVFALGNSYGSINLSDDIVVAFTQTNKVGSESVAFQSSFGISGTPAEYSTYKVSSESIAFQKLAQYFETHYKYTYAIRTAQDLKLEYLRLPQSSIQKNEWKAFLESSL